MTEQDDEYERTNKDKNRFKKQSFTNESFKENFQKKSKNNS